MDESEFALGLERGPDDEGEEAWAVRAAAVLVALREHDCMAELRFWDGGASDSEFELTPDGLLTLARSQPPATNDDGERPSEHGVRLIFVAGPAGGRLPWMISMTFGDRELGDSVRVKPLGDLGPGPSAAAFEACVRAFSPRLGYLSCPYVTRQRRDEDEELWLDDEMLHWRTYFGPGGREGAVDLDAARGLSGVAVRPLHEGTEVVLGERWESAARLRELQRIAEPVVLGPGRRRRTPASSGDSEDPTFEALGITIPAGDPDLIRAHADSMSAAGEALGQLAQALRDPAAVATEEWLRLSMRLAIAERDLAAGAANSERAYGPELAGAVVTMVRRLMPSVVQARRTAERCLAIARGLET